MGTARHRWRRTTVADDLTLARQLRGQADELGNTEGGKLLLDWSYDGRLRVRARSWVGVVRVAGLAEISPRRLVLCVRICLLAPQRLQFSVHISGLTRPDPPENLQGLPQAGHRLVGTSGGQVAPGRPASASASSHAPSISRARSKACW